MSEAFAVHGCIVTPDSVLVDDAIVIQDQEIIWIGEAPEAQTAGFGAQVVAAGSPTNGRYILPGLVDVHCYGGDGQSFLDAKAADEVLTVMWEHRLHDTTILVTSLVTQSPEVLRRQTQVLAGLADAGEITGIHFEDPFISETHKDAQDAHYI